MQSNQILHLDPAQRLALEHRIAHLMHTLTQFNFNDPAGDALQLRQHAYLRGQYDLLVELISPPSADTAETPD